MWSANPRLDHVGRCREFWVHSAHFVYSLIIDQSSTHVLVYRGRSEVLCILSLLEGGLGDVKRPQTTM